MVPIPLFPGVPGGPELLIILLIMVLLLGVPLVLVVGGVLGGAKLLRGKDERVEELEARVQDLERELAHERNENED